MIWFWFMAALFEWHYLKHVYLPYMKFPFQSRISHKNCYLFNFIQFLDKSVFPMENVEFTFYNRCMIFFILIVAFFTSSKIDILILLKQLYYIANKHCVEAMIQVNWTPTRAIILRIRLLKNIKWISFRIQNMPVYFFLQDYGFIGIL